MNKAFRKWSRLFVKGLIAATALSIVTHGQAPQFGKNIVNIRGRQQLIYYYPAAGQRLNRKVLFAPGDGGWRGWAITVAQAMSSWGYDVYGLDTKTYLEGLTAKSASREPEVMADFRDIAKWMTNNADERVALVGWSEGAGLAVLAAADPNNKNIFSGLVAFGLVDENVLGWSWRDNISYVTKIKPYEPSFHCSQYISLIAPLRLHLIQSSQDEYASLDEARKLAAAAKEPKRFTVIKANDHKFSGNAGEFFRTLREGVQWII
jgi:dienelactone hydrolase